MAQYTRAQKAELIEAWTKALRKCASRQEYTIGDRRLRYADLPEIRATLDWLESLPTTEDELQGRAGPRFIPLIPGRGGRGSY